MSMWRLVEIVERFITLSAMPDKKVIIIMFIIMMDLGKKKYIAKKSSLEDLLWGSHAQFSNYHPCNATHKAESDSGFISGFIDDQSTSVDEATPVVIWTENGTNVHCTTKLDITTWQTAKS